MSATNIEHHGNERITWTCGACGHKGHIAYLPAPEGMTDGLDNDGPGIELCKCAHVETFIQTPKPSDNERQRLWDKAGDEMADWLSSGMPKGDQR